MATPPPTLPRALRGGDGMPGALARDTRAMARRLQHRHRPVPAQVTTLPIGSLGGSSAAGGRP